MATERLETTYPASSSSALERVENVKRKLVTIHENREYQNMQQGLRRTKPGTAGPESSETSRP